MRLSTLLGPQIQPLEARITQNKAFRRGAATRRLDSVKARDVSKIRGMAPKGHAHGYRRTDISIYMACNLDVASISANTLRIASKSSPPTRLPLLL